MGSEIIFILAVTAMFGIVQAAPPDGTTIALLNYREKCINVSGSDEGFYQLFGSIKYAQTCLLDHMEEAYQQGVPEIDEYYETKNDFFANFRLKLNAAVDCFNDVFEGAAKCSTEAYDKLVPILKNVMYGLVELICRNGGELFYDIQTPEFRTCFKLIKKNAFQCRTSEAIRTITYSAFSLEQCREVTDSRNCFKGICSVSAVHDLIDNVYDTLLDATKCQKEIY
ncbi:uncharacterized protein LOC5573564 [Aedes aegypti]|uniref:Uncharacterized protein n=1 Tax=Aedes aegypti TaxID=7159 RepID=A0A1S4F0T1_AEDAE|nr:uncharacterized protein LOC5573564 [Aedes aegypti]